MTMLNPCLNLLLLLLLLHAFTAKAHPELAAHDEIVFTYIANRRGALQHVYEEGELGTYIPRFVRLRYQFVGWEVMERKKAARTGTDRLGR